jgi:hypothetical protein
LAFRTTDEAMHSREKVEKHESAEGNAIGIGPGISGGDLARWSRTGLVSEAQRAQVHLALRSLYWPCVCWALEVGRSQGSRKPGSIQRVSARSRRRDVNFERWRT